MEKKELREILGEHTNKIEKRLVRQTKDLKEEFHRMGGFVLDEVDKKLSIITEVQVHQSKKLDATFETVGKLTEDVETLKIESKLTRNDMETVKDELGIIRNELKAKVDRDKFVSLEKRVIFLERKMRSR